MTIAPAANRFIAIDGEAVNVGHDHRYVLLAASDGTSVFDERGLTAVQCFNYLLELKEKNRGAIFVGFAIDYDVNMMLRTVPAEAVAQLWKNAQVSWYTRADRWNVQWIPAKSFRVSHPDTKRSILIYNTFGFFQTSFVKALESWSLGAPEIIARMKGERSNFTLAQIDEIRSYCLEECRLLASLMARLDRALYDANLRPNRWDGAGAIAAQLLKRERVKQHISPIEEYPDAVQDAIMRGYFGGRVELLQQGEFTNVWNYDVRSAYPAVAQTLPTAYGTWRHSMSYDSESPWSLWRCSWRIDHNPICPFPMRRRTGIHYPTFGEGWYYQPEVTQALLLYPSRVTVHEGWIFEPADDAKPFAFIPRVYAERAEAKKHGEPKEKVLKLGLNSLYGKTAQGIGWKGKTPAYRSFFWAGLITSGTRAKLLTAAKANPHSIVAFATDGIISTTELPGIEDANMLGGWEITRVSSLFVAQPGIYRSIATDGSEVVKSRGFFAREIDFEDLIAGWRTHGPLYVQKKEHTRFYGIGISVLRNNMALRCRWLTDVRRICLMPTRKFPPIPFPDEPNIRLQNEPGFDEMSAPYVPRVARGMDDTDTTPEREMFVQGFEQPMTPI